MKNNKNIQLSIKTYYYHKHLVSSKNPLNKKYIFSMDILSNSGVYK